MAGRRCFSEKIVESDAFYKLSVNAQALYYHLNQTADDDGFINSASSVALRIKKGSAALEELVNKRFLLRFNEVYVVKHWRISNSLKNDRLKPLTYAGIAAKIWVKPNKAYTDHPVDGCKTLLEVKTGIHLESSWNPVGIPTEPNLREPNRREENLTGFGGRFSELWNDYPELRRGSSVEAKAAFSEMIRTEEDADTAIKNMAIWKRSKEWTKDGGQYIPQLCNWLRRGTWKVAPAQPANGAASCIMGEAELENIRRLLAEDNDGNQ